MRIKPITADEHPALHQLVAALAAKAGVPMPGLYLQPMAAFVARADVRKRRIIFSPAAFSRQPSDMVALAAHEMGHLRPNAAPLPIWLERARLVVTLGCLAALVAQLWGVAAALLVARIIHDGWIGFYLRQEERMADEFAAFLIGPAALLAIYEGLKPMKDRPLVERLILWMSRYPVERPWLKEMEAWPRNAN